MVTHNIVVMPEMIRGPVQIFRRGTHSSLHPGHAAGGLGPGIGGVGGGRRH